MRVSSVSDRPYAPEIDDIQLFSSNPNIIGSFYKKFPKLSDTEIHDLMKNIWKPGSKYEYQVLSFDGKSR